LGHDKYRRTEAKKGPKKTGADGGFARNWDGKKGRGTSQTEVRRPKEIAGNDEPAFSRRRRRGA